MHGHGAEVLTMPRSFGRSFFDAIADPSPASFRGPAPNVANWKWAQRFLAALIDRYPAAQPGWNSEGYISQQSRAHNADTAAVAPLRLADRGGTQPDRSAMKLEFLARQIFSQLKGNNAVVTHGDTIPGRLSGTMREVDLSIRWQDADRQPRLAIVELKGRSRGVDIIDIDRFAGLLRDTEADRGVLICNGGFTTSTLQYAQKQGIQLYVLRDTRTGQWRDVLNLPMLWTTATPHLSATLTHEAQAGDTIYGDEHIGFFANLSNDGGRTRIRVLERFTTLWNTGQLPQWIEHPIRLLSDKPVHIYVTDSNGKPQWRPVHNFIVSYTVERKHWLGHIDPVEYGGLVGPLDSPFGSSYVPRSEVPFARDESWVEVDKPEAVPVRLCGRLFTLEDAVLKPNVPGCDESQMNQPAASLEPVEQMEHVSMDLLFAS